MNKDINVKAGWTFNHGKKNICRALVVQTKKHPSPFLVKLLATTIVNNHIKLVFQYKNNISRHTKSFTEFSS